MSFYEALLDRYGHQHWWPAETKFEVMIGAVLTQNTNWLNVEKAIKNLKQAHCLDPEAIDQSPQEKLAQLIRPAGYYNIKAKRLKNLVAWFCREYDSSIETLAQNPVDQLREELLSINGIGRETADSIILYALDKLTFVVDAYTYRVLVRHGYIDAEYDYDQVKEFCESELAADLALYNEFHALIVRVGKEHCKRQAQCANCPLEQFEHCLDEQDYDC